ncbi:HAD-IA family hydrolase [Sodalis sp. RH24]|uniref:HAD-IA family hydrolase n=1 Tax=unclassified Sodalis (in: enterobacteria) TaxID=2636512 RepID=UPI0039B5116A
MDQTAIQAGAPVLPVELVLFDLLTAVLDSWTVWNRAAGSEDAGRAWRMAYLGLTYGCGAYRPYETLVAEAAAGVGLGQAAARRLEEGWRDLRPWPEAVGVLRALARHYRLGVVTNCSQRLGLAAALSVGVPFDVVVTSEQAGFYKPDPRPYQLALDIAGVSADRAVFVAGSAYDLFGTAKVGLPTFWHNRVGLAAPDDAPRPVAELATLATLPQEIRRRR